jgi:hypothetical protein
MVFFNNLLHVFSMEIKVSRFDLYGCAGHVDCLRFAIKHGCLIDDAMLISAVRGGHLACVGLLVYYGLPRKPCVFDFVSVQALASSKGAANRAGSEQLRCLHYLLDHDCAIHPGTLILAALRGDLDTVQLLHSRGVPLWIGALEEDVNVCDVFGVVHREYGERAGRLVKNIISVPQAAEDVVPMWETVCYGWARGAPVTQVMEKMLEEKRPVTRAALLCFHVAAGLSVGEGASREQGAGGLSVGEGVSREHRGAGLSVGEGASREQRAARLSVEEGASREQKAAGLSGGEGASRKNRVTGLSVGEGTSRKNGAAGLSGGEGPSREQRAAWAVMGRIPGEVVGKLLVHAKFETPDTLHRKLRR